MLSRVAERVFWLARYLERAEDTARLILVRHNAILDLPRPLQPDWDLLLDVLSAREAFRKKSLAANEKNIISFVFGDRENPSSIASSLTSARENMRTTREVLPSEAWERVNSLYLSASRRSGKGLPRASRHATLNNIIQSCQQVSGMLSGTMNHDEVYQFVRMGRFVERADMSTRIVDVGSSDLANFGEEALPYQNVMWVSMLQSLSAYQMYRLSVGANVQPDAVLDFLLHNRQFPRATSYCLAEIEASMRKLPGSKEPLKVVQSAQRKLRRRSVGELRGDDLHVFLDDMQLKINDIQRSISRNWFTPDR